MASHAPAAADGLDLAPMRAMRFRATGAQLADRLSPPYDVIDGSAREALLARDGRNIVRLILPGDGDDGRPDYAHAARELQEDLRDGVLAVDQQPALYVYEMATADGRATRGLLGAVRLHDAGDGVIFPHENTMAGPVADRLALMEATQANLEPIYLIYDGGGEATAAVARAATGEPVAEAVLPDGSSHRLWAIDDPADIDRVRLDLARRTAVIADGHHRYATYLELQRRAGRQSGPGPWDRGLALLVDSTAFGPQVEAIHRVVPDLDLALALEQAGTGFAVEHLPSPTRPSHPGTRPDGPNREDSAYARSLLDALDPAGPASGSNSFAAVITDGSAAAVLRLDSVVATGPADPADRLRALDVSIVHTDLVAGRWGRSDTEDGLLYAHSAEEAIAMARARRGLAILLRPTPVREVLALARAGLRMPRKSTLFLPKPASGMVLRLFADQPLDR